MFLFLGGKVSWLFEKGVGLSETHGKQCTILRSAQRVHWVSQFQKILLFRPQLHNTCTTMVKPPSREDDDLLPAHQTAFNLPWYARAVACTCEHRFAGWRSIGRHSWMS